MPKLINRARQRAHRGRWIWPLAVVVTVFVASGHTIAAPFMPPTLIATDKAAHIAVFGLLATLIYRALLPRSSKAAEHSVSGCPGKRKGGNTVRSLLAMGLTVAFGLSDEFHQSFTPGRVFDWYDFGADALGAVTAVCAYRCLPLYRRLLEWPLLPGAKRPSLRR